MDERVTKHRSHRSDRSVALTGMVVMFILLVLLLLFKFAEYDRRLSNIENFRDIDPDYVAPIEVYRIK